MKTLRWLLAFPTAVLAWMYFPLLCNTLSMHTVKYDLIGSQPLYGTYTYEFIAVFFLHPIISLVT
jgi:hypothetical protein